jgi:hypothetical protein
MFSLLSSGFFSDNEAFEHSAIYESMICASVTQWTWNVIGVLQMAHFPFRK